MWLEPRPATDGMMTYMGAQRVGCLLNPSLALPTYGGPDALVATGRDRAHGTCPNSCTHIHHHPTPGYMPFDLSASNILNADYSGSESTKYDSRAPRALHRRRAEDRHLSPLPDCMRLHRSAQSPRARSTGPGGDFCRLTTTNNHHAYVRASIHKTKKKSNVFS